MLFSDNNMNFCIPLGKISLFLKFYDLRNTDKIGAEAKKMIEAKVILDAKELYYTNYKIESAKFIRHSTLLDLQKLLDNHIPENYSDGSNLNLIDFVIPLAPTLYLHIGNLYDETEQKFYKLFSYALSNDYDLFRQPIICSSDLTDLKNIIPTIKDFNNYLIKQLKAGGLWEKYCEKNFINIEWKPTELDK